MATHSSIRAWRSSQTEEPGGLQSWEYKESDITEQLTHTHTHTHTQTVIFYVFTLPKSNGTPLQYSCLENPMDRGAW